MDANLSDQTFSVTFWGVRGGYPKPGPTTKQFGGNTTCLEVRAGYHLIIIDAGTGIIGLGESLAAQHQADKQPIVASKICFLLIPTTITPRASRSLRRRIWAPACCTCLGPSGCMRTWRRCWRAPCCRLCSPLPWMD